MKKLLFGLIATIMLSFSSFGQTNEEITKVYNENRPIFAKAMSDFVAKLQPSYSAGMTYETFIGKVATADELSRDGDVILKKAFTYLENGTSISTIQNNESGYEIAVAYLSYIKTKTTKPFEEQLFGKSNSEAKGFWGSVWSAIKQAVKWLWNNAEAIIGTYVLCCEAKLCCQ